jgi:hypothetical protein
MELTLLIIVGLALAAAAVIAVTVGRSRARTRVREAERIRQSAERLTALQRDAGSALVRADERVRLAEDELGFAIAEFGNDAAADLGAALQRARQRLGEAFQLNQLLSDTEPDTEAERLDWNERIISLCQSAEAALGEQASALAARRATARRTPSQITQARSDIERVRQALPAAQATLVRLGERYSGAALAPVAANPEQAERLLDFAARSTDVAESRLGSPRDAEAGTAARAAAETVGRAEALLAAVEGFEVEALHAESTLAAMVAESLAELAEARGLPEEERRGRIDSAIAALERTLAELPGPGEPLDPVASLTAVRRANSALDDAIADRIQRAERRERLRTQLVTAIDDAERQIAAARELITDYRAPIGPDARTRLAEAERELADLTEEREPEPAISRARRAASLAADAAAYARADIERGQGYGAYPGADHRRSAPGVLGAVLGGLAIGGLLDDLGDVGDFFD